MQPGGFFFGITLDSTVFWDLGQKHIISSSTEFKLLVKTDLFTIDFGSVLSRSHASAQNSNHFQPNTQSQSDPQAAPEIITQMKLKPFGTNVKIIFSDGALTSNCLIHAPSFIELAASVGLQFISMTNLTDFYQEHKDAFSEELQALHSSHNILDASGGISSQVRLF